MINWELQTTGNLLCRIGNEGFVSYQPRNPEREEPETALYCEESDKLYILLGDWRNDYEKVIPQGYKECYELYLKNIEFQSPLSDDAKIDTSNLDNCIYHLQSICTTIDFMLKQDENDS